MFEIEKTKVSPTAKQVLFQMQRLHPGSTFLPTLPQAQFLQEVGHSPFYDKPKIIFLSTSGNGVGKTTVTGNLVGNLAYSLQYNKKTNKYERTQLLNIFDHAKCNETGQEFNGFFNTPLFNDYPEEWPKVAWCVSHPDTLRVVHKKYSVWWPENKFTPFYSEDKAGKTYVSEVEFGGSPWKLFYKSTEQDNRTFETEDVGIIIFDEPPPSRIFHACISRLRSGGIIIIQATPLTIGAWFVPEILNKMGKDNDKWWQQVPVWTNVIETAGTWDLGIYGTQHKGNLRKVRIDAQIRNYKKEEIPARVEGQFLHLSNTVYPTYNKIREHIFVDIPPPRNPKTYNYRFVIDPHDRRPPFMAWLRLSSTGTIDVIREWPTIREEYYDNSWYYEIKDAGQYLLEDFIRIQFQIEKELGITADRIEDIMDPNFGRAINRKSGKRYYQEYAELAAEYSKKYKVGRDLNFITDINDSLDEGHAAVREFLKVTPFGDYRLYIDSKCENIDLSMQNYKYKNLTAKKEDEDGIDVKIEQKFKDPADCLRYPLILPWDYVPLPKMFGDGRDYEEPLYGHLEKESAEPNTWQKRLIAIQHKTQSSGPVPDRPKGV